MIGRIIASIIPLVLFFLSIILIVRSFFVSSSPLLGLILLAVTILYVASGAWRRFSVVRGVDGGS